MAAPALDFVVSRGDLATCRFVPAPAPDAVPLAEHEGHVLSLA